MALGINRERGGEREAREAGSVHCSRRDSKTRHSGLLKKKKKKKTLVHAEAMEAGT